MTTLAIDRHSLFWPCALGYLLEATQLSAVEGGLGKRPRDVTEQKRLFIAFILTVIAAGFLIADFYLIRTAR